MAKLRVELEHTEWQTIINLLVKYPYDQVAPLIAKMAPQLSAPAPPPSINGEVPQEVKPPVN